MERVEVGDGVSLGRSVSGNSIPVPSTWPVDHKNTDNDTVDSDGLTKDYTVEKE